MSKYSLILILILLTNCGQKEAIRMSSKIVGLYFQEYGIYRIYHDSCFDVNLNAGQIYYNEKQNLLISRYESNTRTDSLFQVFSFLNCSIRELNPDSIIIISNEKYRIRDLDYKSPEEYDIISQNK